MKVAIAGLGLIGGSLALRLVKSGNEVIAWNHRSAPYEKARSAGIECVNTVELLAESKPDVFILCTPLKAMDSVLEKIQGILDPHTTLTDVGSVKRQVLHSIEKYNLQENFVGAHPMAGNELASFDAADSALFDNATWAMTVENDTQLYHFMNVARMICDGVHNRFVVTNAREHDKATAQISHMPHVVATALAQQLIENPQSNLAVALSAGSWRDMTRVAMTTPERTFAMVEENPDNVAVLLRDMARKLDDVASQLEKLPSGEENLLKFFESVNPYRRVREKLNRGVPEGVYTIHIDSQTEEWKSNLIYASRKGGRIEKIDNHEAVIRHFAHLRQE